MTTRSTNPIQHGGSFETNGPAASYVDVAGAYLDLVSGGAYAQFGAKGPGSVGAKVRTVLAGVVKDALIAAANGDLTLLGALAVPGALTAQALLDLSGAAAGQIKFPASQNASADANTLDDYEEGVWTPTIIGDSVAGTQTYNVQSGAYRKIGSLVVVTCYVGITAKDAAMAGNVTLGGLPFAISASHLVTAALGEFAGITKASRTVFGLETNNGTATCILVGSGSGVSPVAITVADIAAATNFVFFLAYHV